MGKRLTCPRCRVDHEYDVSANEATAPLQQVRCKSCPHRFSYGFAPEYVTSPDPELAERGPRADEPYDAAAEAPAARDRLARHVARHTDYLDRDRDVLLLHLIDMEDHRDQELASIKRMLDVIVKRSTR
jgi:hypothetical protein